MPIYEYRCRDCGHELEASQSMKDEALTTCPACGKATLQRQISRGTGMIFKGSGFYETDYRRKKEAPEAACEVKESKPAGCAGGCACHGGK